MSAAALIDSYDAALFDLDGVVYLGPDPVPGAAEALARLRERQVKIGFVTNNAARPPADVAAHLNELGVSAGLDDVVTSAQAGARLLRDRFGAGAAVLAIGGVGVEAALREYGLEPVASAEDSPVAVLQGWGPGLTRQHLIEASVAIGRGANWLATNTDTTRPTDRGIVPGNGAAVQAVRMAVDVDPEVAGKPYPPLITETLRRLDTERAIFVGDRTDTDIEGAHAVGVDSLFVFTGAHGVRDLLGARPAARPTAIGWGIEALVQPVRVVTEDSDAVVCGAARARLDGETLVLQSDPTDRDQALDAAWAAARVCWRAADAGDRVDNTDVLRTLRDLLR